MIKFLNNRIYDINKFKKIKYNYEELKSNKLLGLCEGHDYSPYCNGGSCRICYKYNKSDKELLIMAIHKIT